MDNKTYVKQTLGNLLIERILMAEGYLDPESIMALTGCNRAIAEHLQEKFEEQNKDVAA